MAEERHQQALIRHRLKVSGIVQGVGFRPFVYRLARRLSLAGWVANTPAGVEIEIQGPREPLEQFGQALSQEAPPLAVISSISTEEIACTGEAGFEILASTGGQPEIQVAPDSAICADCLQELFDPLNRRYRYPFINCTNCGPRYSIITAAPYDRPNTTMAGFSLCPECQGEYLDPGDRRFHAQPNACPACGPQLRLLDRGGKLLADKDAALAQAIARLQAGGIVAIKGIGGYHLAVDACQNQAVQRLRERKQRDEKPFAIMVADLATAEKWVLLGEQEKRLLTSTEAPIVIARKAPGCPVAPLVAPDNGWLGLMLPYAPLHHLLFNQAANFPALVMTSANSSDEPITYQDDQAVKQLTGIADFILGHDRPIATGCDDSVIRVFQGQPLFYRRARGYAPRSVKLPFEVKPILAVGSELKDAVCLARGDRAFLSQHIGDLHNSATCDTFQRTIDQLSSLLEVKSEVVACDLHPDYRSSIHAAKLDLPLIQVQHHHAHLAACMAENSLSGDVIGIIFDGTGYGSDGTIWGGEFLVGSYDRFLRAGHLAALPLPGGDQAVRQPWRMALSYLCRSMGKAALDLDLANRHLSESEKELFWLMLEKGLNSPLTSSCGRLFDAAAALLDIRPTISYDGQAAIELEALAELCEDDAVYPYLIRQEERQILDLSPIFPAMLADVEKGITRSAIARRFHNTVCAAACEICQNLAHKTGLSRVVLSGGVFQNRLLSETIDAELSRRGLQVFTHRLVPPNDGGIALGQAAIAGFKIRTGC